MAHSITSQNALYYKMHNLKDTAKDSQIYITTLKGNFQIYMFLLTENKRTKQIITKRLSFS